MISAIRDVEDAVERIKVTLSEVRANFFYEKSFLAGRTKKKSYVQNFFSYVQKVFSFVRPIFFQFFFVRKNSFFARPSTSNSFFRTSSFLFIFCVRPKSFFAERIKVTLSEASAAQTITEYFKRNCRTC